MKIIFEGNNDELKKLFTTIVSSDKQPVITLDMLKNTKSRESRYSKGSLFS